MPDPSLPLSPSFLSKTVVKMLFLPLITSLLPNPQTWPCCLQEYTSCSHSHSLLCPPLPSLSSISSLQTLISCDTMHHGPSLCMDCVPLAQTSGQRASVTLCLNALLRVQVVGPHKRYPKAKIQIFNFWQTQIPKKSLCPVSLSSFLSSSHPAACVLRDKPSTGFSPSLSNSKA